MFFISSDISYLYTVYNNRFAAKIKQRDTDLVAFI
jgi:hypothetical protein